MLEYLRIAAMALRGSVFRSLLTVLSITIGTFAIVILSSLAESGLVTLKQGIEELGGARILMIAPKIPERAASKRDSYPHGFTPRDRDLALAETPHVLERSMYAALGSKDVVSDTEVFARTDLVAADDAFLAAYRMTLKSGRSFTEEESLVHAKVCVVGHKLAVKLWSGDPVGRKLSIGGVRCRVIGELAQNERLGINFGFEWDDLVIIPLETVADVDPATREAVAILVKTDSPASNDVVKRIINARLVEQRHGMDDFTLYDFSGTMAQFESVFVIMKIVVGLIAGIALVIGGVGVMNMMLVSISERVREIGIRKALGATPGDISAQFLCEALLLSGSGGALGVASGSLFALAASVLIHKLLPRWIGVISMPAVVAALVVSLGVGVLFGYFPAKRAGALDPIQAMRR